MKPIARWIGLAAGTLVASCGFATPQIEDLTDTDISRFFTQETASAFQLRQISSQVAIAEMQLAEAEAALTRQKALVEAGMATTSTVPPLEVKLAMARAKLEKAKQGLTVASMVVHLSQPITLQLENVRIGDVLRYIGNICPVPVSLSQGVPTTLTVTTKANGVPLGSALEIIANATNLEIAPGPSGGLVFSSPGKVKMGARTIDYRGPAWPWSDRLVFTVQSDYGPIGRRWSHLADLNKLSQTLSAANQVGIDGSMVPDRWLPVASQAPGASVTALGTSSIVVAEPGIGPKGERGLWLTLYSVKNGRFTRQSRYFHVGATIPSVVSGKGPKSTVKAGTNRKTLKK